MTLVKQHQMREEFVVCVRTTTTKKTFPSALTPFSHVQAIVSSVPPLQLAISDRSRQPSSKLLTSPLTHSIETFTHTQWSLQVLRPLTDPEACMPISYNVILLFLYKYLKFI